MPRDPGRRCAKPGCPPGSSRSRCARALVARGDDLARARRRRRSRGIARAGRRRRDRRDRVAIAQGALHRRRDDPPVAARVLALAPRRRARDGQPAGIAAARDRPGRDAARARARRSRTSLGRCAAGAACSTKCSAKRSPRSTAIPERCRRTSARSCSGRPIRIASAPSSPRALGRARRDRRRQRSAQSEGARRVAAARARARRARAARQPARQRRRTDAARRADVARRRSATRCVARGDETARDARAFALRRFALDASLLGASAIALLQRACAYAPARLRGRAANASGEDRDADDGRPAVLHRAAVALPLVAHDADRGRARVPGRRLRRRSASSTTWPRSAGGAIAACARARSSR